MKLELSTSPPGSPQLEVRVARKTREARDICAFELRLVDGTPLPAFSAGSHIDVHLPGGLTRQYSLCNAPVERHRYLIGVLREPASRGGSQAMHELVREGDTLRIGAPRNHFALAADARHSLLLAGGIGITPILSMAEHLAAAGDDFSLHYSVRSADRAAFVDRLCDGAFGGRAHVHRDDGDVAQRVDLARLLERPGPGRHVYVCGPKGFIDAVVALAIERGWPQEQVHREFFSGPEVAPLVADESFEVRLARSGRIVVVPKDVSVARALAAVGIDVPTSCEQGVCGTCLTRVVDGVPEHRDLYLTPEEQACNDQFTPCCSRSKTPLLVLDL
ncbi:MAG: PDR/VanB family oxidoreductase [Betaproteobacteria bacterium]